MYHAKRKKDDLDVAIKCLDLNQADDEVYFVRSEDMTKRACLLAGLWLSVFIIALHVRRRAVLSSTRLLKSPNKIALYSGRGAFFSTE